MVRLRLRVSWCRNDYLAGTTEVVGRTSRNPGCPHSLRLIRASSFHMVEGSDLERSRGQHSHCGNVNLDASPPELPLARTVKSTKESPRVRVSADPERSKWFRVVALQQTQKTSVHTTVLPPLFVFAVPRKEAVSSREQRLAAMTGAAERRQHLAAELGLPWQEPRAPKVGRPTRPVCGAGVVPCHMQRTVACEHAAESAALVSWWFGRLCRRRTTWSC